jgi:hypothetical protein
MAGVIAFDIGANIFNVGVTLASLGPLLRTDFNQNQQTSVTVIIGNAPSSDGSVPHIALFEEGGGRIGQYKGSANGHWNQGAQYVTINHDQNGKKQSVPAYLHMAMNENDGICVSGIFASSNGVSWGWTGDVAVGCGGQWYPSTVRHSRNTC